MAQRSRDTLKSYFELGDKPSQEQFSDLIDSLALKTELDSQSGFLSNKIVTLQTETSQKLAQLSQEWQEIKNANFNVVVNPHIEVVDMGTTTAATIEPDKYYIFGEVASLAVGFVPAAEGKVGNYAFQFTCPADSATTLSLPIDVKFPIESGSSLVIAAGNTYQISILNGLAVATSWGA